MTELIQNSDVKSVTVVVKESSNEIALESINTYNKNCLNGHKIFTLDLRDPTEDCPLIDFRHMVADVNRVTHLTLSHCSLTNMPQYVSALSLKSLNLSHNLLQSVPTCILKGLKCLERLDLSNNRINEFETEPQCVTKLRVLNLSCNNLRFIPMWFLTLRSINLTELHYSHNQIGITKESEYENVTVCNLRKLVLQNCNVGTRNVEFLKSVPSLKDLNLSNETNACKNWLSDYEVLFDNPAWKDCIEILNLNHLVISFFPDDMRMLSNLKELYVSDCDIFRLPDFITNFHKLEVLDVSTNSITRLPPDLCKMRSLRVLNVQYNMITSVPDISELVNLEVLDLYRNELESFIYDVDQFQWIDLEQNLLETSIFGNVYEDKKNSYRAKNNIANRLDGCLEEADSDVSFSAASSSSSYSSCNETVRGVDIVEDEDWETRKHKSHPDITTSDEEWQGHIEVVKPKKLASLPKLRSNFDIVFADADD